MAKDVTHDLPKPVADNITACNRHDLDAWMATLAPDAMVNDIQREFASPAAIRSFAAAEIIAPKVTMDVQRAWDRAGNVTVHAKIDGTTTRPGCRTR